jgi:O-antigen/teichoic acid export membrane protein
LDQALERSSRGAATAQSPMLLRAQKPFAEATNATIAHAEKRGPWANVLQVICGTHALALADQAVVSATSFLTLVVIGRSTAPSELGVYALGISLLIGFLTVQESLISLPYTIQRHRPLGTPAEHAGSSLTLSGLLSALAIVTLAVAALGMSALYARPELVAMAWALAAVAPFALLREFGRRFAFAHLDAAEALILDIAVAATQLGAVGWLAWTGWLSAATTLAAIGAGCGLSSAVWWYRARGTFAVRGDQLAKTTQRSWSVGKWLLANQLTLIMQNQITYWLLAWIAGTTATGIYAACMSIASFANPLMLGLSNTLCAKAALALKEGGGARLRREAFQDSLLLGVAMTLFCLVTLLAGDDVVHLLYPGQEYAGHGHTVTVLALAQLAVAIGMPAYNALSSMECTRASFWCGLFGTALTGVLVWCLAVEWGLLGAAYGVLMGSLARSAARWALFLALARRMAARTPRPNLLARILRRIARDIKGAFGVES